MKRSLSILLCIIAMLCIMLCVTSCEDVGTVEALDTDYFEKIDIAGWYTVYYDKSTKVMYVQAGKSGTFTVLVDADGDPLLYKGD